MPFIHVVLMSHYSSYLNVFQLINFAFLGVRVLKLSIGNFRVSTRHATYGIYANVWQTIMPFGTLTTRRFTVINLLTWSLIGLVFLACFGKYALLQFHSFFSFLSVDPTQFQKLTKFCFLHNHGCGKPRIMTNAGFCN